MNSNNIEPPGDNPCITGATRDSRGRVRASPGPQGASQQPFISPHRSAGAKVIRCAPPAGGGNQQAILQTLESESKGAGRRNGRPSGLHLANSLSQRARQRLRIAARLLRGGGAAIDDASGFHASVLAAIALLDGDQRVRLQEQVDWVESYENAC